MSARWQVKRALITGAASGIGQALANALLAEGTQVIALDLRFSDDAKNILLQDAVSSEHLCCVEADVTDAEPLKLKVAEVVEALGVPDFAINCAGINATGNFAQIPQDVFEKVINVNLIGSRNFAMAVLPHLKVGAHFALVASLAGLMGNYAYGAYSTSKYGVVGMAEVLRVEYKALGIHVAVVCPPEVPTPMVEAEEFHPVQRELKDTAGSVTLEALVPYVLDKIILKKRFRVIPGVMARLMFRLQCYLPTSWMHAFVDRTVQKVFAANPDAPKR